MNGLYKKQSYLFSILLIFCTSMVIQPQDNKIIPTTKEWVRDFIARLRGDEKYNATEVMKARIHCGLCMVAVPGTFFTIRYLVKFFKKKKKPIIVFHHGIWPTQSNTKRMHEVYYDEKWPIEASSIQLEKRLQEAFVYWEQQQINEKINRKITKEEQEKIADLIGILQRTKKNIGNVQSTTVFEDVTAAYKNKYENIPTSLDDFITQLSQAYKLIKPVEGACIKALATSINKSRNKFRWELTEEDTAYNTMAGLLLDAYDYWHHDQHTDDDRLNIITILTHVKKNQDQLNDSERNKAFLMINDIRKMDSKTIAESMDGLIHDLSTIYKITFNPEKECYE